MTKKAALVVAIALILAGCSSSGIVRRVGEREGLDRLMESAGPPVDSVPYLIRYEGWQPLGTDKVAVWATASDGYLLTVTQPCDGLQSAAQIQLTSRNAVVRRGVDAVKFTGQNCGIAEIRNLDFRVLKR